MTEFSQVTASLRPQMKATLVRPDLLEPLRWPMIILMAGTVGLALVGAPNRTITLCGVLLVLVPSGTMLELIAARSPAG